MLKTSSPLLTSALFALLILITLPTHAQTTPKEGDSSSPLVTEQEALTQVENQTDAGMVLTGGNTQTQSISFKHRTQVDWKKNVFGINGRLLFTSSEGVMSGRNWLLGLRYERVLTQHFNLYVGESIEGDTFAGFERKLNTDIGGKYFFTKKEKNYLFTETGYRFTSERRVPGASPQTVSNHFIRLYLEGQKQFAEGVLGKVSFEALPDLTDSENLEVNIEPSLSSVLTDVFSLKTGILIKYDRKPPVVTNDKFDYTFTTALVAVY